LRGFGLVKVNIISLIVPNLHMRGRFQNIKMAGKALLRYRSTPAKNAASVFCSQDFVPTMIL
jgi:hypothetical protein